MKANEFVKKFGWDKATRIAHGFKTTLDYSWYDHNFETGNGVYDKVNISEIKRLVESHELVQRFGGMDEAKKCLDDKIYPELGRAIKLVESCQ